MGRSYPARKGTAHPDTQIEQATLTPAASHTSQESLPRYLKRSDFVRRQKGQYKFYIPNWNTRSGTVALEFILELTLMSDEPMIRIVDPSEATKRTIAHVLQNLDEWLMIEMALRNKAFFWMIENNKDPSW